MATQVQIPYKEHALWETVYRNQLLNTYSKQEAQSPLYLYKLFLFRQDTKKWKSEVDGNSLNVSDVHSAALISYCYTAAVTEFP